MSQTLTKILRDEIARLSRKEIRAETGSTRKAVAQFRRDIAELKRLAASIDRRLATIETMEKKRLKKQPPKAVAEGARYSPAWLRSHRQKLGISAADYAKLVGVSTATIYGWENEKSKPRQAQLAALVAVRGFGKREALRRLELLDS